MKKIVPILIVGVLVLSGIGAIAIDADINNESLEKNISLFASEPTFLKTDNYLKVDIKEETSLTSESGKPMLPVITKVFTFNPGTEIFDVDISYNTKEYKLTEKIAPAPKPVPLIDNYEYDISSLSVTDLKTYSESNPYPVEPYTISYPFGIYQGKRSQMVVVRINSQYIPAEDTLIVPEGNIDISIIYDEPLEQTKLGETYDMLIISPQKFVSKLNKLVNHKSDMGISCIIETVEDIYDTYDGRNQPEDIKLAIKNAIEEYDITYVLLAGGHKRQTLNWWIPEFRGWNDDGWESGYSSDLYYADVYKNGGADFEDWDSNENDIIGEWRPTFPPSIDEMDFYPDVVIGRLPFNYGFELNILIKKIIDYENNVDASWFEHAIMIAGDTHPNGNEFYEGEMETQYTADLLEAIGFTTEKLWTSIETFTGPQDVISAITGGAGIVHFAGHGNPASWSSHPPMDDEIWINGFFTLTDSHKLRNRGKYPLVVIGGCHNGQFNSTLGFMFEGIKEMGVKEYFDMNGTDDGPDEDGTFGPYWLYEWVPRDMSSALFLRNNGGSIATIANTGLGYGYIDDAALMGLGGWIEPRVFHAFAEQEIDVLGEMHTQSIVDYINIIGFVNEDQIDRKTIEEFVLLGDPSLKFGP